MNHDVFVKILVKCALSFSQKLHGSLSVSIQCRITNNIRDSCFGSSKNCSGKSSAFDFLELTFFSLLFALTLIFISTCDFQLRSCFSHSLTHLLSLSLSSQSLNLVPAAINLFPLSTILCAGVMISTSLC
jgi:hypothetical protein